MSVNGLVQLKKISLLYCPIGGSSKGAREFIRIGIADWAKKHSNTQVVARPERKGKHPIIIAEYVRGENKVRDVKNCDPLQVCQALNEFQTTSGRKMAKIVKPILTSNAPIQGGWRPGCVDNIEFVIKKI